MLIKCGFLWENKNMSEKFDYFTFLLSAEKNRRESQKMEEVIHGLSDEQLDTLLKMQTENKSCVSYTK